MRSEDKFYTLLIYGMACCIIYCKDYFNNYIALDFFLCVEKLYLYEVENDLYKQNSLLN